MKEYFINNNTIALIKKDDKTIIFENNKKLIINNKLKKILNNNCIYNGSTLEGRIIAAREMLNLKYKVPIIISNSKTNELIFMPIYSLRSNNSFYININKILNVLEIDDKLRIFCENNVTFDIKMSINVFNNIFFNSIKLKNIMNWLNSKNNL